MYVSCCCTPSCVWESDYIREKITESREHWCCTISIAFFYNLGEFFLTMLLLVLLHLQISLQEQVRHIHSHLISYMCFGFKENFAYVNRLVLLEGVMSHSWRRSTACAHPGLLARPAAALMTPAAWAQLTAGAYQKSRNVKFTTPVTLVTAAYKIYQHTFQGLFTFSYCCTTPQIIKFVKQYLNRKVSLLLL